jgi:hypothetical protein
MLNSKESYKQSLLNELDDIAHQTVLNPAYRKRKLMMWSIRTFIAIILYILFWEYQWVRTTLIITIPLSLLSFLSIFSWNYLLQRKMKATREKIMNIEQGMKNDEV